MPKLYTIPTSDPITCWNIESAVGYGRSASLLDVKFVQYLLYVIAPLGGMLQLPLSGVDGRWGPQSNKVLRSFEEAMGSSNVVDDIVDVLPNGHITFDHNKKGYHLSLLQANYYKLVQDQTPAEARRNGISSVDITDTFMAMPDFCGDMPSDLKARLMAIRPDVNV